MGSGNFLITWLYFLSPLRLSDR